MGDDTSPICASTRAWTQYYAAHLQENPDRAAVWSVLAEYLARYVPPEAHVLELGAGYCYWINSVDAEYKVAIDIWQGLPDHAGLDVRPVVHDLARGLLPVLEGQQFDVVLASNLLEHLELDAASRLVAEIHDCLRQCGRFIVIQPNYRYGYRHYFDDYTHRTVFTHVSLAGLLRAHGFAVERVEPRFMPYSVADTRLPVKPWLVRAYLMSPIKPFAGQMLVIGRKPVQS